MKANWQAAQPLLIFAFYSLKDKDFRPSAKWVQIWKFAWSSGPVLHTT